MCPKALSCIVAESVAFLGELNLGGLQARMAAESIHCICFMPTTDGVMHQLTPSSGDNSGGRQTAAKVCRRPIPLEGTQPLFGCQADCAASCSNTGVIWTKLVVELYKNQHSSESTLVK
jgi:hypothetical protein